MEGLVLMFLYLIIAVSFWYYPVSMTPCAELALMIGIKHGYSGGMWRIVGQPKCPVEERATCSSGSAVEVNGFCINTRERNNQMYRLMLCSPNLMMLNHPW